MAESLTVADDILPTSGKCEVGKFCHPSHSTDVTAADDAHDDKMMEKCPLNGLLRFPADTNGLINHNADTGSTKSKSSSKEHCESPETDCKLCDNDECSQSVPEQQSCDCLHISNVEHIPELTSDIQSLNLSESVLEDGDGEREIVYGIEYVVYKSELQMPDIMRLITKDLSEPYSIYTYRYFIHNWPKLCFLAMDDEKCVGAIVCKLDMHKKLARRGYIAMLAVDSEYRRKKIGSHLVLKAIKAMISDDCDEVVLETEITNQAALRLYENLGFVRDKRLFRYYLNGVDALRLKLWLR